MKTAIVTGGTKGIGLSIVNSFINKGYNVVVGARKDNDLEIKFGSKVKFVSIDVKIEKDHQKLIKTAFEWTGQIDVYINNAGFSEWRPIQNIDESLFEDLIGTNLKGTLWGCKAAAKSFKNKGVIINISSLAGKRGSANNSLYCASKFGVNGLTQALAKELGSRSIRVNAVCPVLIKTEGLTEALDSPYSPAYKNDSFFKEFINNQSALGRLPTGSEVGALCLFLASNTSSAITGQCINIDCGVLPQ